MSNLTPLGTPYVNWHESCKWVYQEYAGLFAVIALSYLPMVYYLGVLMDWLYPGHYKENKEHQKFDAKIKPFLILWNAALAIFSIWGAVALLPHAARTMKLLTPDGSFSFSEMSLVPAVCDVACYDAPVSAMIMYFNLSKMPEFVDTIFLRLRKRPVIFLHWYHHIATMLYCWYANQIGVEYNCTGLYFAAMNLTVHSFMYTYYGLTAAGYGKLLNQLNLNVLMTAGQIIQMVGGVGIIALSTKCDTFDQTGFALASVMYTSYLLLFSQLFWNKYEQRIRSWCGCPKEKDA